MVTSFPAYYGFKDASGTETETPQGPFASAWGRGSTVTCTASQSRYNGVFTVGEGQLKPTDHAAGIYLL